MSSPFSFRTALPLFLPHWLRPLRASWWHALLVLPCLLVAAWPAYAARADRDQPMHIEADTMRHDEARQASVFTGNVVLTRGSIVLRGARLEVRQDAQGYYHGIVTGAAGQRAFFRQTRDTQPTDPVEHVEGEGEVIEYDGRREDVRLLRRGQLRRYSGGKLSDDIMGNVITYNNLTDVFTVDSVPRGNSTAQPPSGQTAPGGRVRAVLAPKAAPAAAAGSLPQPPLPAPQLQPSGTLGTPSGY